MSEKARERLVEYTRLTDSGGSARSRKPPPPPHLLPCGVGVDGEVEGGGGGGSAGGPAVGLADEVDEEGGGVGDALPPQ